MPDDHDADAADAAERLRRYFAQHHTPFLRQPVTDDERREALEALRRWAEPDDEAV
jgi:hypothetical protein